MTGSSNWNRFLAFLVSFLLYSLGSSTNITTDQSALLAFKSGLISDPYGILENWTLARSSPLCDWTCGRRHHRVTALNVSNMGLAGEIPPEFGNLSFLASLDMRSNNFTGDVPSWFGSLPRLEFLSLRKNSFLGFSSFFRCLSNETKLETLDMSFNSITGRIPESIANLGTSIKKLSLEGNRLSGFIPSSLSNLSSLEILILSKNSIQGRITENIWISLRNLNSLFIEHNQLIGSIPDSIFNISALEFIAFSNNNLSGPLPDDMCLRLPKLKGLYLSDNGIHGQIPSNLSACPQLQTLSLSNNNFSGTIPQEILNLEILETLYLGFNRLTGFIPQSFPRLVQLEALDLGFNELMGFVPRGVFNISTLTLISMTANNLSGILPSDMGSSLPNLGQFFLGMNNFDGILPKSIANCSELVTLDVSDNRFSGPVLDSLGQLSFIQVLDLETNNFTSEPDLRFITSLMNSQYLSELAISYNPLNGILPMSIGNLSSSLNTVYASECEIKGNIPNEIGNLSGLVSLYLDGNDLTGVVPSTLDNLMNLQRLSLGNNKIKGFLPNSLCRLNHLGALSISANRLTGPIPDCFGNISSLRNLYLESNNLTSDMPDSIWNLQDLLEIDISSNSFTGTLSPQIGNLKAVTLINLSFNQFTNNIPNTFQGLKSLINLSLAHNRFQGSIPESMGSLLNLGSLDLSHNNLSGMIPKSLELLKHLESFNVLFNELSSEIPTGGPFVNFTSQSFMSNEALCGPSRLQVSPCLDPVHRTKKRKVLRGVFILLAIVAALVKLAVSFIFIRYRRKSKPSTGSDTISDTAVGPSRISYYELSQAIDGFSEGNFLGRGSSGSVYKGIFRDGTILDIKVFNLLEGALKTFDAECEVLRNLRHRNLAKVISSCSNLDFKALVLEYFPNGNLDKWLHAENYFLNVMQRLDIMIDVGTAFEYLHYGYSTPLVHCDLKPSNVLLDENMVAHLSDFGIAKFFQEGESNTHTRTLATMGYMAPEYGLEGMVSTRCDVYSYGIMLMETFTGKQPSEEMFGGDFSLRNWIKDSQPHGLNEVVDANIIRPGEENFSKKMSCVSSILELALRCTSNSPGERMNVRDILPELKKLKLQLTAYYTTRPEPQARAALGFG